MSDHSIKKILKGTVTGFSKTVIAVLASIITLPLFLGSVGIEMYGLFTLLVSLTSFLKITDFGITTAATNKISYLRVKKDWQTINKVYSGISLFFASVIIPIILIVTVIIVADIVDLRFFLQDASHLFSEAKVLLLILLGFSMFHLVLGGATKSLYAGLNQIPIYNFLDGVLTVIYSLVFIGYLLTTPTIFGVVIFQGMYSLTRTLVFIFYFKQKYSWFKFRLGRESIRSISDLKYHSFVFFVLSITTAVVTMSDNLVLSRYIGVSSVAIYAIAYKIFRLPISALPVTTSGHPIIAGLFEKKDWQALSEKYKQILRVNIIAKYSLLLFVLLYSKSLINVWVGPDLYHGFLLMFVFFMSFLVFTWSGSHWVFINAMFLQKTQFWASVFEATLNLVISIVLIPFLGILGVAIGTVVANILTVSITLPRTLKKYIDIHPLIELKSVILRLFFPTVIAVSFSYLNIHFIQNEYFQLILSIPIFVIFLLLIYRFAMTKSEQLFIFEFFNKFSYIKKNKKNV